ncbi:MAG: hypothetical protein LBJ96_05515 [Holosporaceae bacterium]|jgi:hypothetical protein|nr:hypothetical protein [Holosporaceae bacterium]
MKCLKNNELELHSKSQLCETHNGNSSTKKKTKLVTHKSYSCTKAYHPLKRKKVKLHKLKFASDDSIIDLQKAIKILETTGNPIVSKRYGTVYSKKRGEWSSESEVIDWLIFIKTNIKKINAKEFFLNDRVCTFGEIVVFANKKRREMGAKPFYVEGITEY